METTGLIAFDHLSEFPELVHFQTTRQGGYSTGDFRGLNMSYSTGDDPAVVLHNRTLVAETIGMPLSGFVLAKQTHSDIVRHITETEKGLGAYCENQYALGEGDALITDRRGIVLCVKIADCIPIICYDPHKKAIAAIHAGWQGTAKRIAAKTIAAVAECFGSDPANIRAGIGIGAGFCCYEVGQEVFSALKASIEPHPQTVWFRQQSNEKYLVDLREVNRLQLIEAGLNPEQIETRSECTICGRERYFSFRGRSGEGFGQSVMGIALK